MLYERHYKASGTQLTWEHLLPVKERELNREGR
jgi:hypothetical protein